MEPNTHSIQQLDGLNQLTAAADTLAAEDLTQLADSTAAQRVLALRRLLDRLEGQWLRELAAVDGRGAAGADQGTHADSTGWLRGRLRAGRRQASGWVHTARALFGGPCTAPPARWPPGPSPRRTPPCWPPAPRSCRQRPPRRPSRCCSRPLLA
jgi:hypothetical protein